MKPFLVIFVSAYALASCVKDPLPYNAFQTVTPTDQWLVSKAKVVSLNTEYNRPYNVYPYTEPLTKADYRKDPFLIFPVDFIDERLSRKERILGVTINEEGKAYRFKSFGGTVSVIHDQFQDENIVIAGSNDLNFMVAFKTHLENGSEMTFQALNDEFPAIMSDAEGNRWDVFGKALDGPRKGEQLIMPKTCMSYWFAWGAFYRDSEIYN